MPTKRTTCGPLITRLDIARMLVGGIVAQSFTGKPFRHVAERMFRQDGDAVPRLLAVHGAVIAQAFERLVGKLLVDALDLLQRAGIRLDFREPLQDQRQAGIDRIDVPRGKLHGATCTRAVWLRQARSWPGLRRQRRNLRAGVDAAGDAKQSVPVTGPASGRTRGEHVIHDLPKRRNRRQRHRGQR